MLQQQEIEFSRAMPANRDRIVAEASVRRAHKGKLFSRRGRGFSKGEIAKAGVDAGAARRMGIMIDRRRKSVHDINVDLLKKHTLSPSPDMAGVRSREQDESGRVEVVEAAE